MKSTNLRLGLLVWKADDVLYPRDAPVWVAEGDLEIEGQTGNK
jgi:hypothetical protein